MIDADRRAAFTALLDAFEAAPSLETLIPAVIAARAPDGGKLCATAEFVEWASRNQKELLRLLEGLPDDLPGGPNQ